MIYADLYNMNDIGFNSGVHYWSIKALPFEWATSSDDYSPCYRSIGITTIRNDAIINLDTRRFIGSHVFDQDGYHYHYDSVSYKWAKNETLTIKLDCDNWTVSYFLETEIVKKQDIVPNQHYFFAMSCCAQRLITHLQVMETPQSILFNKCD